MGKQTSKKHYSFKGRRTIGENKSNHSKYNSDSESISNGSTTDDMMSILNSDSKKNNLLGMNSMTMSDMNPMAMSNMNPMAMSNMNPMAMSDMNPISMPDMNPMAMNQMPGMNPMAMNQMPGMNPMTMNQIPGMNMMGKQPNLNEIDNLMVNTLVPVNNSTMNFDNSGYMNPSQMANNLGALAKLTDNNLMKSNHMGMNSNHQQVNNVNLGNLAKLNM